MGTQSSALDGHGQVQSPEEQAATTPRPRAPSPQLSSISDYESEDEIEERLKREAAIARKAPNRVEKNAAKSKDKVRKREKKLAKKWKNAAAKNTNDVIPSDAENSAALAAVEESQKEKQEDAGVPSIAADARAALLELEEADEEQRNSQDLPTPRLTDAKIPDQSDDEDEEPEQSSDRGHSKLSPLKRTITPELEPLAEAEAKEESEDSEGDEEAAAVDSLNAAIGNAHKRKREEPLDDDHEVHNDFSPAVFRKRQPLKDSSRARALTQLLQEAAEHGANSSSDEPFARRVKLIRRSSGVSTPQEPNGGPVASESENTESDDEEPSMATNPKEASPVAPVRHFAKVEPDADSDSSVPFDALADDHLNDTMDDALDMNEPGSSNEAGSPAVQSPATGDDRRQQRNGSSPAANDDIDPVTGAPYALLLPAAPVNEDDVTTASESEHEDPNEDVFEGMRSSGDADTMDLKDAPASSDESTNPSSGSASANRREVNSVKTAPGQSLRNRFNSDLRRPASAVASQDEDSAASDSVGDVAEKSMTDVVSKDTPSGGSSGGEEAGRLEQPEHGSEDVIAVEEDVIMDNGGEEVQVIQEEETLEQERQKSGHERNSRRDVYDVPVAVVARKSTPAINGAVTAGNRISSATLPETERLADESADEDRRPLRTAAIVKRRSTKRKPKPVLQLASESEPSLAKTSLSDLVGSSEAAEGAGIQANETPVSQDDGPSAIELLHELPGDDLFEQSPPRQARSFGRALSKKRKISAAMKGKGVDRGDSSRGSEEEEEAGSLMLDSDVEEFQAPGPQIGSQKQSKKRRRAASGKRGTLTDAEIQAIDRAVNAFRDDHGLIQEAVNDMIQSKNPRRGSKEVKELWTRIREAVPDQGSQKVVDLCRRIYHNFVARGRWTPDQDAELRYMVGRYGKAWSKIGELINRHRQDCRIRWRDYVQYGDMKKTSNWDQEEESELMTYLQEGLQVVQGLRREERRNDPLMAARSDEELIDWNVISKNMGGRRSAHQCREKYKRWRDAGLLSGDISQLEPPSSSKRLQKAAKVVRKIDVNDKLRLVNAIRESGVGKDELIPWRHIVEVEFGSRFQRPALQLLWSRLRQVVPNQEFMATRSVAEALIEDWDDEYRNYDELLNDETLKDKAVIPPASGSRPRKRSSQQQRPRFMSKFRREDSPETPSRNSMAHRLTQDASSPNSQVQAKRNLISRPSGSGSVASTQAGASNAPRNAFEAISQTPTSAQPRNSLLISAGHRSNVSVKRNSSSKTGAVTGPMLRPMVVASRTAAAGQLGPTRRSLVSGLALGSQRIPQSRTEAISDSEPDIGSRAAKSPIVKAKEKAAEGASSAKSIPSAIRLSQATGSPASNQHVDEQASVDLGAESDDGGPQARQASPDLSAPEDDKDSAVDIRPGLQQTVSASPVRMGPVRKTLDQDVMESPRSKIGETSSGAVPDSQASQPSKKLTARRTAQRTPLWAESLKRKQSKTSKVSPAAQTESAKAAEPAATTNGSRKPASKKRARQFEPASPINLDDFKKTPRKKARVEAAKPAAGVRRSILGSGKKARTRPLDSSDADSDMEDIPARLPIDAEES